MEAFPEPLIMGEGLSELAREKSDLGYNGLNRPGQRRELCSLYCTVYYAHKQQSIYYYTFFYPSRDLRHYGTILAVAPLGRVPGRLGSPSRSRPRGC